MRPYPREPRPMRIHRRHRPTLIAALCLAMLSPASACNGTGTSVGVPRALRERAQNEEVVPYDGFAVSGLRLYRVSGSVPDHGWSTIVGIDANGALVERAALMRRLGDLEPTLFAERALAILLGEAGTVPLQPGDPRSQFATEDEWSIVRAPARDGDAIVFFTIRGEMNPTLIETRVDTTSFALSFRPASQVLLAAGREASLGPSVCMAVSECNCWNDCVRMDRFLVPGSDRPHFRRTDSPDDRLYVLGAECVGDACARVCRVDHPTAYCDPAIEPEPAIDCERGCVPSEAPYHCDTLENGCRRVEHPIRMPR